MSTNAILFKNGFLYVFLVSANTYCISQLWWMGIAVFGFLISFLWSVNVKRVAVSNGINRLVYAIGAMLGGITGVLVSLFFKQLITK